jgi:hypothetical protein
VTENKPPITVQDIDRAPSTLPAPTLPAAIQDELQKYKLAFVKVSEEKVCLLEENACLKRSVETSKILDGLLTPYANRSFIFMCCYCGVVAFLIVASGWKLGGFDLPSGVLQVLTGSTAVTVIGLVGMVLTGIFVGARKH